MRPSGASIIVIIAGIAGAAGAGDCMDAQKKNATAAENKCEKHVTWAMTDGLKAHPKWYDNYTQNGKPITSNSSFATFQCLEWIKTTREKKTDGHGCKKPCEAAPVTFGGEVFCGAAKKTPAVKTNTNKDKSQGGGMPWWGWALIVVGALAVIGGLAYAFMGGKKPEKKKKKKRAAKAPEAPAAAAPAPVATTSIPMPVYASYQPVQYAAPMQYAAPVTYAAPAASVSFAAPVQYAAPMEYAAPVQYAAPIQYAAPVQYAAAPAAATAFDMIDANNDGVISRQELAAAMR